MNTIPDRPHRRSGRLRGYDYTQTGGYFITLCTQNRECLFGHIVDGDMRLNDAGRIVLDEWRKTTTIRNEIQLDEWVIMPNHFHGIFFIVRSRVDIDPRTGDRPVARTMPWDGAGCELDPRWGDRPVARTNDSRIRDGVGDRCADGPAAPTGPRPRSVGAVVAGFKSVVTKRINVMRNTPGEKLWQRNYWERVIRNESELNRIREYIQNNPAQWEMDKLYVRAGP